MRKIHSLQYVFKNAQSVPLIYNRVVSISLVYNYITHNVRNGVNKKNANKRTLKKVISNVS